MYKKQIN